jgi:hypothetical protein
MIIYIRILWEYENYKKNKSDFLKYYKNVFIKIILFIRYLEYNKFLNKS